MTLAGDFLGAEGEPQPTQGERVEAAERREQ